MLRVTPSEVFGAAIDKPIEKLKQLKSVIREVTFNEKPPFNVYKQIFDHCVREHNAWTRDLIIFHLGDQAELYAPYTQSIIASASDVDLEFVLENLFHTRVTMIQETFSSRIKSTNDGDLKHLVREYAASLGKVLLERSDSTPLMDAHTLLTTNTITDVPKKTLALNLGFDEHMEGGLHEGELLFLLAPTGGGKSTIMLYESLMGVMQGYETLYVSLEISEQLIKRRLSAAVRHLRVPESALRKLHIKRFPTKGVTLDEVLATVDSLDIDFLLLDYLDLLKTPSSQNMWLDLEELTAYFRGQLVERELLGITASQVNRGGTEQGPTRIVQITDVAYSIGKMYTADYVVTATPIMESDAGANIILNLAKNRRGRNWMQPTRIDFDTMTLQPILGVGGMGSTSIMDLLTPATNERRR